MSIANASCKFIRIEDNVEVEYQITAEVCPIIPGNFSGPPDQCYENEGGEVEILSTRRNGYHTDEWPFSESETDFSMKNVWAASSHQIEKI